MLKIGKYLGIYVPSIICTLSSSLKERDIGKNTRNSYANKWGGTLKCSQNFNKMYFKT